MLTIETVDRIRSMDGGSDPVLSVYLGLRPTIGELRSVPARLKDLLAPVRERMSEWPRDAAMALRNDIDAVISMSDRVASDLGRGVAIFRSSPLGLDEFVSLPGPVRDRAVVDTRPYVRPLDATLEHYPLFCAVVISRRKASIFRFAMGRLVTWEEMAEEEVRKSNYGGFSGYEEWKVRNRAEEIAHRHYRDTAERLRQLQRSDGFDELIVGGPREHVDGLVAALDPQLEGKLAGTFTIDPGTMTPATVEEHCERIAADHDRVRQERAVEEIMNRAGSGDHGAVGLTDVLSAVNQRAVDRLVVQAASTVVGRRCADCGWLAAEEAALCPACGEGMKRLPDLLDAMAHAVRQSGGTVQHVFVDTPLQDHEVGARLRFSVTPV